MRVGVDIDGVLRDWSGALISMIKRHYPDKLITERVDTWRIKNIDLPYEELRHLFAVTHVAEIYRDAEPLPHAIKDLHWLVHNFPHVEFVCVSHQWGLTIPNTLTWLGNNDCRFSELHFTTDKWAIDVDYLIDDSPNNYDDWVKHRGSDTTFVVFDQLYNQHVKSKSRIHRLKDLPNVISLQPQSSKYRSENII